MRAAPVSVMSSVFWSSARDRLGLCGRLADSGNYVCSMRATWFVLGSNSALNSSLVVSAGGTGLPSLGGPSVRVVTFVERKDWI